MDELTNPPEQERARMPIIPGIYDLITLNVTVQFRFMSLRNSSSAMVKLTIKTSGLLNVRNRRK